MGERVLVASLTFSRYSSCLGTFVYHGCGTLVTVVVPFGIPAAFHFSPSLFVPTLADLNVSPLQSPIFGLGVPLWYLVSVADRVGCLANSLPV